MTAMLMPVLVGGVALAVDIGVLATARAQLRTVADAAAMAGANRLALPLAAGNPVASADVTAAQSQAIAAAADNSILRVPATLLTNSQNTDTGTEDVVVGYINPDPIQNPTRYFTNAPGLTPYFNAVKVTARRDATHDGIVPAFFSRIFGNRGAAITQTSVALCEVTGMKSLDGTTAVNLLPIVLDLPTYKAMIAGQTTDQYTYNASTGTVTSGPDGVTESKLYPVSSGSPGNWGTIKVGVSNNSTSTLSSQIQYGITPAELATFPGGVIQLDPKTGTIVFPGNPGISAGIKSAVDAIIGRPVIIPIYDPSYGTGGNGNNAAYTVVKFARVRVLASSFQGNPKYVIIQPAYPGEPEPFQAPSKAADWVGTGVVRLYIVH
jgi:hypothetical protein